MSSNKKPKPEPENRGGRRGGIVAACVVLAAAGGIAAYAIWRPSPAAARQEAAPRRAAAPQDSGAARRAAQLKKELGPRARLVPYAEGTVKRPADPRPAPTTNVIIFLIDTLRADRIGAYGYKDRPTSPAMDGLAAEGVVFESAYAAAPWTLPSVASLFTSTFLCEHSTISRRTRLPSDLETLAEKLDRCGYDTYSLFANSFLGNKFGLSRAFELPAASTRNGGEQLTTYLGPSPRKPLFLYVHNLEPHNPYHFAPPHTPGFRDVGPEVRRRIKDNYEAWKKNAELDFREKRAPGTTDITPQLDAHIASFNNDREDYRELYDASVRYADGRLASAIGYLKSNGLWDDTLFILCSDHGEEFGEHGGWLHDQALYEEQIRIPLIVKFPRGQHAGKRVAEPVTLLDVVPTVLEVIDRTAVGEGVRGVSLAGAARGERMRPADEPVVVGLRRNVTNYYKPWREARGDTNVALRKGRWKAIWNVDPDTLELFDLEKDPGEKQNVASQEQPLAESLREFARKWWNQCIATARRAPDPGALDAETSDNLRDIGYIE
jgi:arylsulfatase